MFNNFLNQAGFFGKKLISTEFLFDIPRDQGIKSIWLILIIFGGLLLIGFFIWLIIGLVKKNNPVFESLRNKIFWCLGLCGFLGLIVAFFRFQGVSLLGSHFALVLILITCFIWLGFIIKYLIKNFKRELLIFQEEIRRAKYLPKKNKNI